MMHLKSKLPLSTVPTLLASHVRLQLGCYFSTSVSTPFGDIATSEHIADHYWNSLSQFPATDLASLEVQTSPLFQARDRKLAFYLDPTTSNDAFVSQLEAASYSIEPEMWLGVDHPLKPASAGGISIQEVTAKTLADFLRVFSQAFGGPATEKDGYGDIPPEYLTALTLSQSRIPAASDPIHRHFISYLGSTPVGCASIHYDKTIAGLYNVGTIPSQRGNGIGTVLSLHAINYAMSMGVPQVFLQTQPNGSVQRFYEKLGCEQLFDAAIAYKA